MELQMVQICAIIGLNSRKQQFFLLFSVTIMKKEGLYHGNQEKVSGNLKGKAAG
jgi:hypothetical protein